MKMINWNEPVDSTDIEVSLFLEYLLGREQQLEDIKAKISLDK